MLFIIRSLSFGKILHYFRRKKVKMINISTLDNYERFRKTGLPLMHQYLSELLNAEVNIEEQPIEQFEKYIGLNLIENIKKYAYIKSDEEVVLSIKIIEDDGIKAMLPIYIVGPQIGKISISYLEQIGSAISIVITQCYCQNFNGAERMFNEYLQDKVIYSCFAKRVFEVDRISFLISYLKKLCLQTFEGKEFSTGFILTRSAHDYEKEREHVRGGEIYALVNKHNIFKNMKPDRRIWYLVDGNTSFYLMDNHFILNDIYTIQECSEMHQFWDEYLLSKILWGGDLLFRVINSNQISIVNSDGIEFIATENSWKLRDYKIINELIKSYTSMDKKLVTCLLYYIMHCSRCGESTIIWLPQDTADETLSQLLAKRMRLVENDINIQDQRNVELVKRILSSDGVTIIDISGNIISNGCVVNLSEANSGKKLIGTGEAASKLLSSNGISIKVSQDGSVKIYYDIEKQPFVF